jgi:hypothetical protein
MNSTARRVPRITGLPAGTSGSTMIAFRKRHSYSVTCQRKVGRNPYTFASAPSSFTMLDKNAFASPNSISVLSR